MSNELRVCLFDADAQERSDMATSFQQMEGVSVLDVLTSWNKLREYILHAAIEVVGVNLDDASGLGLDAVRRITQAAPMCTTVGFSRKSDPASIIQAMRAGCNQFVACPVDMNDLTQALDSIRERRLRGTLSSKRICVIGSSGGAGATTVSCNLAIELAHLIQRRVGLVDLNLEFGDIGCAFDAQPDYSVTDVAKEGIEVDHTLLTRALHELPCNVSLLTRPNDLERVHEVTPEGISNMLKVLAEMLPFVVLDLPRMTSFFSAAALENADHVLIVTQLGVPFLRNATRIYEAVCAMGAREDRIEIVLNRCRANFEKITPDDVEAHFGRPVFAMVPNDYRRVQAALDLGQPILSDAPSSPARLAIHEMAKRLARDHIGDQPGQPASPAARQGFFRKLWGASPAEEKQPAFN